MVDDSLKYSLPFGIGQIFEILILEILHLFINAGPDVGIVIQAIKFKVAVLERGWLA